MQKWLYVDLGYLNVEHIRFMPHKNDPAQKWEYLTVEAGLFLFQKLQLCFSIITSIHAWVRRLALLAQFHWRLITCS
jgi:hypothetical protein